ncbi:glycine hydroxymethyltransferase shm1 [Coemansia sp. RSA 1822]|nr:glycine hydroxymethyltransferase shm1 [Coemansia sp. RSA 638]KAJ2126356.1 glycine hydroxymethyltransferase shm1 [Coemansia sp. RSA 720]KAJ2476298.1 glycine hydroxymethyltransferase shm1 [Coemansia sp. RSA 2131]KAJ2545501.1 glycine hydroxymethyltransferase shm1 [Coemansia sp. RSA 1853]KAJ2567883.1 glycine hydroxymethyltransferase shm1 [Coemansia sp. RSA 1822]KAJ2667401.1 glycine hydroxymethyltransferase shm1 [Coemansia sp. RSA 1199]
MTKPVESYNAFLNTPLSEADPDVAKIIESEKYRQFAELELIASENFTSQAVMEANGSALTNKYSEGLPGARYYGGNEYVDQLERLCQERALAAFKLDAAEWGVNVQPYSGSTANFAALTALLKPFDRLMGLDLPSGGHLTHGYQTDKKKISSSSIYFQSMPYRIDAESGLIDYDRLEENAELYRPQLLICGASAYPRDFDYARLRRIADKHSAYLLCDMAHISGLVAAGEQASPFETCDIVTTTTHKTLRGPRAGLIFFRRRAGEDRKESLEARVNQAVFPSCQGGPHNNTIAGIAVALKQACTPEFVQYAKQVRANTQALAKKLGAHGYRLSSGGSDNHLVLWDLKPLGLTGSKVEKVCELVNITLNKNSVCGDKSAVTPGGVRIGTSALTSRGFKECDFEQVGEFLHRTVEIATSLQSQAGSKLLKDFMAVAVKSEEIAQLQKEVEEFATSFPMPGFDVSTLTKPQH